METVKQRRELFLTVIKEYKIMREELYTELLHLITV